MKGERENLYAYTELTTTSYPGYVSLNKDEMGKVFLTIRSRGQEVGQTIEVAEDIASGLSNALMKQLII